MNPTLNRNLDSDSKTLQNAPSDPEKLKAPLKIKKRKKEEAMHIEDRGLITIIEILKVALYWVSQERRMKEQDEM